MVSTKGEVWVWGDNDSCQCGTDASSDVQHYKDELDGLRAKLEAAQSGDKGGKGHDQHGIQLITESIAQVIDTLRNCKP
jgi:alpha-tubulin suppressor-like RCC1 family protein